MGGYFCAAGFKNPIYTVILGFKPRSSLNIHLSIPNGVAPNHSGKEPGINS